MEEINEIVEKELVDTVFQPIVELSDGEIVGYEAYSRGPEGSDLYRPYMLLSEAKSHNLLSAMDKLLRNKAIVNASERGFATPKLLFINVDPAVFYDGQVDKAIMNPGFSGISPDSVVIEISENSSVCNFSGVFRQVEALKKEGFHIAVDDIGESTGDITSITQLCPDFLKLENKLIRGIDSDEEKREKVRSIQTVSNVTGTRLIAEGVETKEELITLISLGIYAVQGNYMGKPAKELQQVTGDIIELIRRLQQQEIDRNIMSALK